MSAWPSVSAELVDEELLRMSREIPGFGGMFVDNAGSLTVYMQDTSRAPEVRMRLDLQALGRRIRVVPGQYNFEELYRWRSELNDVMAEPGVVFTDIDERRNRVVIGIDEKADPSTFALLDSLRAATSAPREAVIVERVAPFHNLQTLRQSFRPIPNGVQIAFDNFLCTLGYNAIRQGVQGFVTNSHCSTVQGQMNSTVYFQPLPGTPAIGVEAVDPPFLAGGQCPPGRLCRFSDTLFARYNSPALAQNWMVARPTALGSITVNPAAPRWTVAAVGGVAAGAVVNKVGRTTGWSQGAVIASCVNVNAAGTTFTLLCQNVVNAAVGGGDSGSPVFTLQQNPSITHVGILWGGNAAGTQLVYSPFANVIQPTELGPIQVSVP